MKKKITPREKHIARGYCCGSGCKMCPYDPKHTKGTTKILKFQSQKSLTTFMVVKNLVYEPSRVIIQQAITYNNRVNLNEKQDSSFFNYKKEYSLHLNTS